MERLGSVSHRMRRFAFIDQIEEAASLEQQFTLENEDDDMNSCAPAQVGNVNFNE